MSTNEKIVKKFETNKELINAVSILKHAITRYIPEPNGLYLEFVDRLVKNAFYSIPEKVEVEYEPQTYDSPGYISNPSCPTCGNELDENEQVDFCPCCGQALKWED